MKSGAGDRLFNLATLIIAIAALVVAFRSYQMAAEANRISQEANEISRQSTYSQVVVAGLGDHGESDETDCYESSTEIRRTTEIDTEFTVTNRGGKACSLVSILYQENGVPWAVAVRSAGNPVDLPIDIEPGTAETLHVDARFITTFRAYPTPDAQRTRSADDDWHTGEWRLAFSDGTQSTQEVHWQLPSFRLNADPDMRCSE